MRAGSEPRLQKYRWGPSKFTLAAILAGSLILYLQYFHFFYVGFFGDDASFILAARSLLQWRWVMLQVPGQPPIQHFLPGYPLALTPWVLLCGNHWNFLKYFNIGLVIGSGILFWRVAAEWLAIKPRTVATLLFCFNPTVSIYSGTVMSDPALMFLTLGVLFLQQRVTTRDTLPAAIGLGCVVAWCSLTKPIGALVIPALAAGLIWDKRFYSFRTALPLSLFLYAEILFLLRSQTGTATDYTALFRGNLLYLNEPGHLATNVYSRILDFTCTVVPGIGLVPFGHLGIAVCAIIVFILMTLGFVFLAQRQRSADRQGLLLSAGLYLMGYILTLCLWTAWDDRYCLPALPLVLIFIVAGAQTIISRLPRPMIGGTVAIAAVFLGIVEVHRNVLAVLAAPGAIQAAFPGQTFSWIRANTPEKSIFLGEPSCLYLYTERQGLWGLAVSNADRFRYGLIRGPIHYIFERNAMTLSSKSSGEGSLDQAVVSRQMHEWVVSNSKAYPLVYENLVEGTRIYRVIPDRAFVEKYRLRALLR